MTLYLARHGRSLGQGLFLGQSDPELSEQGRAQSAALAERLAEADLAAVYSSGLRRSMQTAAEVARQLGLAVQIDARWNELGYGLWDGLAWDEIERGWPEQAQRKLDDWWGVTPEGGEAREAFVARVRQAYDELRGRPGPALLVGHAGVNAVVEELARDAEAFDWARVTRFQQDYGDVMRLEME
ncbi:MAG: histidine phosphatase family protein [Bryobacterales bacterium]|nr:histidine phosphatase family protein [Bryobacterales bacterium]